MANESKDPAYDRHKQKFDQLEVGSSETAREQVTRVNVALVKQIGDNRSTPARDINRRALRCLSPYFPMSAQT